MESENRNIEAVVVSAHNTVVEVKKAAPGSEMHIRAMAGLTDLLAKDPDALAAFCKMRTIREGVR